MSKYSKNDTIILANEIDKSSCLKEINAFIFKEGYIETLPLFTSGEFIIDMDCVEAKICAIESRLYNKSMDSAFTIINDSSTDKKILLVEFRFNYEKMKNLDKRELFGKVSGSTNALKLFSDIIEEKYYFIFNSNLKEQARRRFRNMVPSMPDHFIATDIHELKAIYFQ